MLFELWERYRTIVILLGVAALAGCAWLFYPGGNEEAPAFPLDRYVYAMETEAGRPPEEAAADARIASVPEEADKSGEKPAAKMYVDVKGSVQHPGMYEFAANDRVQHVIALAGGFLPDADVSRINLAQPLTDGMVIWVPRQGEDSPPPSLAANCPCQTAGAPPAGPPAAAGEASGLAQDGKINLNHASLEQLMSLPGIGETRARAIISYREKNGPFTSPEQLKNVSGIGEKTYAELKDKLTAP